MQFGRRLAKLDHNGTSLHGYHALDYPASCR